ncbi:MAG: hypothetical protein ACAI35_08565 [Candidatus Methylacidiphilales bacterium]|nr:hypothetical protein [Candidatus Methylacidiphilales bacterium]
MKKHVRKFVELLRLPYEEMDHDAFHAAIFSEVNGDKDLHARLNEFVREAYTRACFSKPAFKVAAWDDRFHRQTSDGSATHHCPLAMEHVWVVALECALEDMENGATLEDMHKVMTGSGMYTVINSMFREGKSIEGGRFLPLALSRQASMPCPPPGEEPESGPPSLWDRIRSFWS